MFVGVKYFKESVNGFAGAMYTYRTDMSLSGGEVVAAPVKNRGTGATEDKRAMVVAVDLPEPTFACSAIEKYWQEEVHDGDFV